MSSTIYTVTDNYGHVLMATDDRAKIVAFALANADVEAHLRPGFATPHRVITVWTNGHRMAWQHDIHVYAGKGESK